jgi:hypothetical protein
MVTGDLAAALTERGHSTARGEGKWSLGHGTTGSTLHEQLAGVNDLLWRKRPRGRVKRWPGAKLTLRNGARIIDKTWPADD